MNHLNIKKLKAWLATLPPDMDDGDICSDLHGNVNDANRVVAFRYKDGSGCGIVVNPMGSHIADYFYERAEVVSVLNGREPVPEPATTDRLMYLACPYSHDDVRVKHERCRLAGLAAVWLMQQGHIVYSPITHNHPLAVAHELPTGWDYWHRFDSVMLRRCDEVMVLTLPGWRESRGIKGELEMARELALPVRYLSLWTDGSCSFELEDEPQGVAL